MAMSRSTGSTPARNGASPNPDLRSNFGVHAGSADQFAKSGRQIGRREKPVITEQFGVLSIERFEFMETMWSDITHTGQPAARKFHAFRIDVTRLHKTARFLRAPARVTSVDQAAFLIHELVEIAPRTGEKLSKIIR